MVSRVGHTSITSQSFFPIQSNTFDGPRLTSLDVNPGIETNFDELMYESGI